MSKQQRTPWRLKDVHRYASSRLCPLRDRVRLCEYAFRKYGGDVAKRELDEATRRRDFWEAVKRRAETEVRESRAASLFDWFAIGDVPHLSGINDTGLRLLLERYAEGRSLCNCRRAYYNSEGRCEYGCQHAQATASREVAARAIYEITTPAPTGTVPQGTLSTTPNGAGQ